MKLKKLNFVLATGLLLLFAPATHAQEFLADFLTPPGPAKTTVRVSTTDTSKTGSPSTETPTSEQKVLVYVPFLEHENQTYGLNLKWDHLRLATDQKLNSGADIPNHFFDAMMGLSYKRSLNATDSIAANLSFGSASDQPFASGGSSTLSATFSYSFLRDPQNPTGRWIWLLNYSNNRTFLNNIPLPAFAYVYMPSRDFIGVFGVPFIYVRKAFTERWAGSFAFFITNIKGDVTYQIKGPIQAYFSVESGPQTFYRENRGNDDDRIFYSSTKALVGVKAPVVPAVMADVFVGTTFDRFMYEAEDFELKPDGRTTFDSRLYFGLGLSGRF